MKKIYDIDFRFLMKYGIMSTDMIPAPVRRPTKEDNCHGEPCASAGGSMFGEHGIMSSDITPAPVRRPTKEDNCHDEPCASAGGSMFGEHGIMLSDIIPALICRPTGGRTVSPANHVHAPRGNHVGTAWYNVHDI